MPYSDLGPLLKLDSFEVNPEVSEAGSLKLLND